MDLKDIIGNTKPLKISGTLDLDILGISYNSQNIKKNDLFVCLKGSCNDGHKFISDAVSKGAVAVAVQENIVVPGITTILVKDTRSFLASISATFFGNPAQKLITIGITGTKGKTTTSFMIKYILESAKIKTGLIGTIGALWDDKIIKLNNTTPESYEIQKYLASMVKSGCKCVVIEASSIGLKSHRLDGFDFNYGIFTNFSHDHIGENEHKDMNEYLKCKSLLFQKCKVGFANIDDDCFEEITKNHISLLKTFGFSHNANYSAKNIKLTNGENGIGVSFDFCGNLEAKNISVPIPGKFNVYNALGAAAVCDFMNVSKENIKNGLLRTKVKGRVEPVIVSKDYSVFIDYAHNAISMKNVLTTLRKYKPSRLITLFGAGGNRPKIRRYEMGATSGNLSDLTVITSDNPRFEDPLEIIEDIKKGINETSGKYTVIPERKKAIKYCLENAKKGDIVVIAGKGHEDYQEIKGIKYPFDERDILFNIINGNL